MGSFSVDLNNIYLDDANFYEDDPRAIIHFILLALHNKLKQRRSFKKRNKQRINACNMASNKMVGLVHARILVKRNRAIFYL